MKTRKTIRTAMAAAVFCLAAVVPFARAEQAPRIVELTATRDNQFKLAGGKKGPLVLKAGERVTFRVTSFAGSAKGKDGAVHSFVVRALKAQGWDVRLKEGLQEFTLTAPAPGEYVIECTVYCGEGHDDMKLKMKVE